MGVGPFFSREKHGRIRDKTTKIVCPWVVPKRIQHAAEAPTPLLLPPPPLPTLSPPVPPPPVIITIAASTTISNTTTAEALPTPPCQEHPYLPTSPPALISTTTTQYPPPPHHCHHHLDHHDRGSLLSPTTATATYNPHHHNSGRVNTEACTYKNMVQLQKNGEKMMASKTPYVSCAGPNRRRISSENANVDEELQAAHRVDHQPFCRNLGQAVNAT